MFSQKTIKIFVFIFLLQGLVLVNFANAYIDPGTGSFIFQMAIAGVLGSLFFVKTIFRSIRDFFFKKNPKKNNEETNDAGK